MLGAQEAKEKAESSELLCKGKRDLLDTAIADIKM